MVETIEGDLSGNGMKFAIVVSKFNDSITRKLLSGAVETFEKHGVSGDDLTVVKVPGAFEIPVIADRLVQSKKYSAICCLGAVITGETTHDQYINHQISRAIMDSSIKSGIPVLFGVLTCQTMDQAIDRTGGRVGHKGSETALAAIEMANLISQMNS
jgi:6,7-dimethyl-8-ribityllumazine synthase